MVKKNLFIAMLLLAGLLASSAQAAEYYVDQKSPAAGDKNPGTEDKPFATIQAACDVTKPGDTVWVKQGVYEENIEIKTSGRIDAPITLSAWKDDSVRIGSVLRDLPPADQWKPVEKTKSWATVLPADLPKDATVILDGRQIVTEFTDAAPLDKNDRWATYRASSRTLMINVYGPNPAVGHKLQLARADLGILLREQYGFWRFKKLEFGWCMGGFFLGGHGCLAEDCYFHNIYRLGIFIHGRLCTIRRCNFHQCGYGLGASGSGPGNIIEDCLFIECGQDAQEDIVHRFRGIDEGGGPAGIKGDAYGQIFRYNIIADNKGGLWYDGGETACRVIGNAFWDNSYGNGIYNEYAANDTLVMGNYFLHACMTSSWCTRLNVIDNFFDGGCVVWHNRHVWPFRNSYMTMRGNALVDPPGGYLQHYGPGWGKSSYPEGFARCSVDYNRFRIRPEYPVINDAGTKVKTLEEVRAKYGWEIHGEFKTYDPDHNDLTPESMGGSTVTFRLPWGPKSHLARPMLSDAGINGVFPAAPETFHTSAAPSFFWRVADGNYDNHALFTYETWFPHEERWAPNSTAGYGQGENNGARWYIDAERKFPEGVNADTWPTTTELSNGNHWLVVEGLTPEKIPAQGLGYWSPTLATAEGAKINVSFKIKGKDLQPTDRGTPAVWLMFTNETGQNRQRVFIVGKGDDGKMARPELTQGSYDWKEVKQVVPAPKGAIRMALFLGILPCKGLVGFDDINIKTDSAPPPAVAMPQDALPPRLPLERFKQVFPIDLSKLANRGLADEDANDGKGGWSDQGPAADMRALKTGQVKYGGVPFEIGAEPQCAVVLKSSNRNPGQLPEKVTIPVGRKLDTLFFLHAGAWSAGGGDLNFEYVIHYKDKKDVTLLVTGENLADWTNDPVKRFPKENNTFSTAAVTVPVPQFGQGTIYRMEWSAPAERRTVEIESIEFVGGGKTVPILLAVTGVTEW